MDKILISAQNRIHIRTLNPIDIDSNTMAAWSDLEFRAIESNAYLSPHFILPAIKYLERPSTIRIVLIELQHAHRPILIGLGVFKRRFRTKHLPLLHLETYQSTHSFSSGLLVDREHISAAINGFFDFFHTINTRYQGVVFSGCRTDGSLYQSISDIAASRQLKWFEFDNAPRAVLIPAEAGQPYLDRELSTRKKDTARRLRSLQKMGHVTWQICDGATGDFNTSIERFLELEHMGWKGKNGSSLLAQANHADFFRAMAIGFLQHRQAFFCELALDGKIISSTFNLISGKAGFAFKIGWDPTYAKMSIGTINEWELIKHAVDLFPELDYIDSGAAPGSYMENLWMGRQHFIYGAFATTRIARYLLTAMEYLRRGKQQLQRLITPLVSLAASVAHCNLDEVTALLS